MDMFDRKYIVFRNTRAFGDYYCERTTSDPYEEKHIQIFDDKLHKKLSKIFRKRRLTSEQIKELSRSPAHTISRKKFPKNDKLSLLWITVLCRYQNTAELLVRSGADVNGTFAGYCQLYDNLSAKSSILHALVQMYPSEWNKEFIALVLEHSTDSLNARDDGNRSALDFALLNGRVQTIKLFLEKGADVNVASDDMRGNTPLLQAADTPEADKLLPLLIKHGADINFRNKWHQNVLTCLTYSPEKSVNLARFLIEKGASLGTDSTDLWPHQPILAAAIRGKNEFVNLFLDHGENVNAHSKSEGAYPLFCAANCDNPAVLLTLLKRGADIDQKTINLRQTALHNACNDNPTEENVKILLSAGADMLVKDSEGKTPYDLIHLPYLEKPARIVQLILKTLALRKARLGLMIESEIERPFDTPFQHNSAFYHDCKARLSKTKSTRITESCSFFDLLAKCYCQIARFMMGDCEFETKYKLHDPRIFDMYAEDIRGTFKRAQCYYESVLEQEDVINEAVSNILPDLVVSKVTRYILICEECELKKIVKASRSGGDKLIV